MFCRSAIRNSFFILVPYFSQLAPILTEQSGQFFGVIQIKFCNLQWAGTVQVFSGGRGGDGGKVFSH
jgi:hypothetical protein